MTPFNREILLEPDLPLAPLGLGTANQAREDDLMLVTQNIQKLLIVKTVFMYHVSQIVRSSSCAVANQAKGDVYFPHTKEEIRILQLAAIRMYIYFFEQQQISSKGF